jgi:hypothetical protein
MIDKPSPDPKQPRTEAEFNSIKLLQLVQALETGWQSRRELLLYQSKVLKAKYEHCVEQGFSEQQALALCIQEWG